jgi:predicted permease
MNTAAISTKRVHVSRPLLERLWHDVRWAMRSYLATPGLTLTILVTLALGLGASLASFSLINALLLRPLGGVLRPQELVRVGALDASDDLLRITSLMRDVLRESSAFASVCGLNTPGAVVTTGGAVATESVMRMSGDCAHVLGVRAQLGRLLTTDDDVDRSTVAVITDDFWRRALGGRQDVVGSRLEIDGAPFTVVGVTSPEFRGLSNAFPSALMAPISAFRQKAGTSPYWCDVIARLAPGVSERQARAQVEAMWPRLVQTVASVEASASMRRRVEASRAFVGSVSTGMENVLRPTFRQPLVIAFALSVLMLGVCGANVANLLVARRLARQRELAMRAALGASEADLLQQSIVEVLLPVSVSALLAVPIAQLFTTTLVDLLRTSYAELDLAVTWDRRVAIFLAASIVGSVGLAGALHIATRGRTRPLADVLRAVSRTSTGDGRSRRLLVAAQIALCVALVGNAATFVRTLQHYYAIDPGFAVGAVLAAPLNPLPGRAGQTANAAYYADLLSGIEALPNVRSASFSTWMPLGGPSRTEDVDPIPTVPGATASAVTWTVSDRFFESLGIPLRDGQPFARGTSAAARSADASGAAAPVPGRTAILSESLARRLFPGSSPLGRHIRIGADAETQDLVVRGVAADARLGKPQAQPAPVVYLSYWEDPRAQQSPYLLVRTGDDHPERVASVIAATVRGAGREFTLWTRTISTQWDAALMRERLLAGTSTLFGLIGLVIGAVGIFGILSHYVTCRRAEIGIRIAIGADAVDISRLLFREIAGLLIVGNVAGVVLLQVTSRSFASLLFGVAPGDLWLLALTLAMIAAVASLAVALALRRATSIDPLIALRTN